MHPALLEARILEAIDALRSGTKVEDDFIECKREWPGVDKVRQLAGLCNRAAGVEVIFIVGIDEKTGQVQDLGALDPADWWAGMRAKFDDEAWPELVRHIRVKVGQGESVIGMAFDTSRVPYVVKVANAGGVHREVPMREGTATRSAHRRELMRLLLPTIRTPAAVTLEAEATFEWTAGVQTTGGDGQARVRGEEFHFWGMAAIFVEHLARDYVMLPAHGMRVTLACQSWSIEVDGAVHPPSLSAPRPATRHGVEVRSDGVLVTGPGRFLVHFSGSAPLHRRAEIEAANAASLRVSLDVIGATQPIALLTQLGHVHRPSREDAAPDHHTTEFKMQSPANATSTP